MHVGHEKLLARAFRLGERVLIGVSGDSLAASFHKRHPVSPFEVRVRGLKRFLKSQDWIQRARITELHDPFGPALRRKRLQAIIVSTETRHSAVELNRLRRKRGLAALRIHVVPLTRAREGGPISSSRIRGGEIDREGNLIQKRK